MVATVTEINDAKTKASYFFAEGYYARDSPEHKKGTAWFGKAAAHLRLGKTVAARTFRRVLHGDLPSKRTHERIRLGHHRDGQWQHKPGIEITLSAPKTVSFEGLVFGNTKVIEVHDEAVRATLEYVERELLVTRVYNRETRKMERVPAGGMVAALFRHSANRNGDPQLHTHALIANATLGPDGKWRSLDTGRLNAYRYLIGAFYRNALAKGLKELGYELSPTMVGHVPGFEIRGYSRRSIEAFSTRRADALDWLRRRNKPYNAKNMQEAVLATRPPKADVSLTELEADWQARAQAAGLAPQGPDAPARRRANGRPAEPPQAPPMLDIVFRAVAVLEERASVFAAQALRTSALAHSPGAYSIEDVDAAIAALVADGHLIAATRPGIGDAYVTDRARRAEQEVVARMRAGIGAAAPLASAAAVAEALAETGLTDGQRAAVETLLTTPHRTVGVQGAAGTGKTTMLRTALSLCGGMRVVGLAPSASAAHTLAREGGLKTHTLQWFLARCRDVADGVADADTLDRLKAQYKGAFLIVDEASMISTDQARALLRIADRLEIGRLALIGDTRQLRSVAAGQPFRQLQQAEMPKAEMTEIVRQRDPILKGAVIDAFEGRPSLAIKALGNDVVEVPMAELGEAAARHWLALAPKERARTSIFAPTHALNEAIAETLREGLRDEGALSGEPLKLEVLIDRRMAVAARADGRNLGEGDVLLFHENLDDLDGVRIAPGDGLTVAVVEPDGDDFVVQLDHPDGTTRRLRPSDARATPNNKPVSRRFQVYDDAELEIEAGDSIRWTRNNRRRGIDNGARGTIEAIDKEPGTDRASITIAWEDVATKETRRERFDRHDPQLKHIRFAYATTVHAGQGTTTDRVIGVLDSGHPGLTDQSTFYTEISRARDDATLFTDSLENLVETLEANAGDRMTALEALNEDFDYVLEARRQRVETALKEPGSALAKTVPPSPERARVLRLATRFEAWQRADDAIAAGAERAGIHPSAHAEHAASLERLRTLAAAHGLPDDLGRRIRAALETAEAVAQAPKQLAELAAGLAQALAQPERIAQPPDYPDPPIAVTPATGARYDAWRARAEQRAGDGDRFLAREDLTLERLPEDCARLRAAVGAANARSARDDDRIAAHAALGAAAAWVRDWDALARDAGDRQQPDPVRTAEALEAAQPLADDPALPESWRTAIEARVATHRALTAYRSWRTAWTAVEQAARDGGIPIDDHPDADALTAEAAGFSARPELPAAQRAELTKRVAAREDWLHRRAEDIAEFAAWTVDRERIERAAAAQGVSVHAHAGAATLTVRARELAARAALPPANREDLRAHARAYGGWWRDRALAAFADWDDDWQRLRADARTRRVPVHTLPGIDRLDRRAAALADDPFLPDDRRNFLRRWRADFAAARVQSGVGETLRALARADAEVAAAGADAVIGRAIGEAGTPAPEPAVEAWGRRLDAHLGELAQRTERALDDPDLGADWRTRLSDIRPQLESGRTAVARYLDWAARWRRHDEACRARRQSVFDHPATDALLAEAQALAQADGLDATLAAHLEKLVAASRACRTERAHFTDLARRVVALLEGAASPEATVYPTDAWQQLMADLTEALAGEPVLTDRERGWFHDTVDRYRSWMNQQASVAEKSDPKDPGKGPKPTGGSGFHP